MWKKKWKLLRQRDSRGVRRLSTMPKFQTNKKSQLFHFFSFCDHFRSFQLYINNWRLTSDEIFPKLTHWHTIFTYSKPELNLHKRRIHEGFSNSTKPKKFACPHCDFRQVSLDSLSSWIYQFLSFLQGDSSALRPGLGWLEFWVFHPLPNSASADWDLAEVAVQLGKMVEHPNQSQPNPGLRAEESPCRPVIQIMLQLEGILYNNRSVHRSCTKKIRDNHIKIRHIGTKDIHCPLCEKMFPTKQYMTTHLTKVINSSSFISTLIIILEFTNVIHPNLLPHSILIH